MESSKEIAGAFDSLRGFPAFTKDCQSSGAAGFGFLSFGHFASPSSLLMFVIVVRKQSMSRTFQHENTNSHATFNHEFTHSNTNSP
jgi:hypothetical protein